MKRRLLQILLLCVSVATMAAETKFTKNGFVYAVTSSSTVAVVGTDGALRVNKVIPATVTDGSTTYTVTVIRSHALQENTLLMKLTVPAQLDSIGEDALLGCTRLAAIEGLESVNVVGSYAFARTGLKSFDFSGMQPKSFGHGVFAFCTALEDVKLPLTLKELPECTFSNCKSLTTTNVAELPLTTIGRRAFNGCAAMTSITLPASVTSLDTEAMAGMESLTELTLPENLTEIGDMTFAGCSGLKSLVVPQKVKTIGMSPFFRCTSLQSVTLPPMVTNLENMYVFDECPALQEIALSGSSAFYSVENGVLYNLLKSKLIAFPAALSQTVSPTIPNSATPLAPGALSCCRMPLETTLPARITEVPREAFAGVTGMKVLNGKLSTSLKTIGARAFTDCRELGYMVLPLALNTVGQSAFVGTEALEDIYLMCTSVPAMNETGFADATFENATLHVRAGKTSDFQNADGWSRFVTILDDSTTKLDAVEAENTAEAPIYNLQGQRVQRPQKGIYVQRGKKVLVTK